MSLEVRRGTRADVDRLEPLWHALREHHAALPEMRPVRNPEDSWAHRRAQYVDWLEADSHVLLLAERDGEAVGYAVLSIIDSPFATWDVGERAAEIETLSVLPAERGGGVGRALTEAAGDVAADAGATAVLVGVAHSNHDAIRFYEREGFGAFYVQLMRS